MSKLSNEVISFQCNIAICLYKILLCIIIANSAQMQFLFTMKKVKRFAKKKDSRILLNCSEMISFIGQETAHAFSGRDYFFYDLPSPYRSLSNSPLLIIKTDL